jgi:hypothetical protein
MYEIFIPKPLAIKSNVDGRHITLPEDLRTIFENGRAGKFD